MVVKQIYSNFMPRDKWCELKECIKSKNSEDIHETMSQEQLNNLTVLHRDKADKLNVQASLNELIRGVEHRSHLIGYSKILICSITAYVTRYEKNNHM